MSLVPLENISQDAVLKTLNLNPNDPHTHAVLLICQKYGLDPLLKHVVLIQGRPYITRDGYLHHAHESGQFDGIEIVDEGETDDCWWARASVYRKDMARPFTYKGRYPKKGAGNPKYGPEMAIKTAEVMALRRAFDISGLPAAEEQWDTAEPAAPSMPPAVAKGKLLALAGGDKEAAAEAWKRAGIPDGQLVSDAQLSDAESELRQLAWSWAPTDGVADDEDGGDDDDDPPPPPAGGPGDDPGSGGSTDREAAEPNSPAPAGAGQGEYDTPPEPAHTPQGVTVRQVAQKAGLVFKADYDAAPRGKKTLVSDRLRHALTWAVSGGRVTSLNDLTPDELGRVWQRLDDLQTGRYSYTAAPLDDAAGVTFTSTGTGRETTVLWADAEMTGPSESAAA